MLLILLLTSLTAAQPTAAQPATSSCEIRLHPNVILAPGPICLKDVADIKTADSDLLSRLESMIVTQYSQSIAGASVGVFEMSRALAQANVNPAAVLIYGANVCRITIDATRAKPITTVETIAKDEEPGNTDEVAIVKPAEIRTLADQLTEEVARLSGIEVAELRVGWSCSRPGYLEQPADEQRFVIKPRTVSTLGTVRFMVLDQGASKPGGDITSTTTSARGVHVSGRAEYVCLSVIAKRCLKPGEVILPEDVELRARRVTSYRDIGVNDLDAVIGQEVSRTIAAQAVVLPTMIRKLHIVKRHQFVDVYIRDELIEAKRTGKALSDGAYGDTISVSFEGKQKSIVQGKVAGPGEIVVSGKEPETVERVAWSGDRHRKPRILEREK
jgi:flagella basal body P-ring formation protein FlgA